MIRVVLSLMAVASALNKTDVTFDLVWVDSNKCQGNLSLGLPTPSTANFEKYICFDSIIELPAFGV